MGVKQMFVGSSQGAGLPPPCRHPASYGPPHVPPSTEPLLWLLSLPLIQTPPLSTEALNQLKSPCLRRLDTIMLSQGTHPVSGTHMACVHVASPPFFSPLVLWWKGNGHSFESWPFFLLQNDMTMGHLTPKFLCLSFLIYKWE